MGINLNKNLTKTELKEKMEKDFPGIKIVYINYCYDVDNFIADTNKLYKLY